MEYTTQVRTYTIVCCPNSACGVEFGISAEYEHRRREDHHGFYCPNGHSLSYGDQNDLEKAQARSKQLERHLANREEDLRAERASHQVTEHRRRAAKGQLTKTKRRVANGVCPCCNRSFVDLHRHMAGQHPDYAEVSK